MKRTSYFKTPKYKNKVRENERRIYFDTAYRNREKKRHLKTQEEAVKILENFPHDNKIQSRKTFVLWELLLDVSSMFLENIEKAEKYNKNLRFTKRKFNLYKHKTKDYFFLKLSFHNLEDATDCCLYLDVFGNLTHYKKLKARLYRVNTFRKNYELVDNGKYSIKYRDFREAVYRLNGIKKYKFHLSPRGKSVFSFWFKRLK